MQTAQKHLTRILQISLSVVVIGAGLLCGCQPDPRLAVLEKRCGDLQERCDDAQDKLRRMSAVMDQAHRSAVVSSNAFRHDITNQQAEVERLLDNMLFVLRWQQAFQSNLAHMVSAPAPAPVRPVLFQGLPWPVYREITNEAARRWPRDYEMQNHTIDREIAAYRKIHP